MRGKVQRWFGRRLDFRFGNGLLGLERWLGSSCRFRVRVFLGFRDLLFWRWRRVSVSLLQGSNSFALIAIPGLEVFPVQVGGKCFED